MVWMGKALLLRKPQTLVMAELLGCSRRHERMKQMALELIRDLARNQVQLMEPNPRLSEIESTRSNDVVRTQKI
jgi:hypothetical protein